MDVFGAATRIARRRPLQKNRSEFWAEKFQRNIERDARNEALLIADGWRVLTIWECQTTDNRVLRGYLRKQFPRRQTASAFRGAIYRSRRGS
jgi:G:T-mismatch repair DNA endonuclease (very short patch repair protein)